MWGKFELIERLGSGPAGECWRARQANGYIFVALKKLSPELSRSKELSAVFTSGANALRVPVHRDLVPVVDVGEVEGTAYSARAWVDGVSVAKLLNAVRRRRIAALPAPVALTLVLKTLDVLQALHATPDRVHGHLTANNVFVLPFGEVKVTDAGLVRIIEAAIAGQSMGATLFSEKETAPEQARGEVADVTTDVFAAGALLFELLTATRPTDRSAEGSILIPANAVKQVPPILASILVHALEEKRAARYPSIAALTEDLKSIMVMGFELDNAAFSSAVRALSADETIALPPPVSELLARCSLQPDLSRPPPPREVTPPKSSQVPSNFSPTLSSGNVPTSHKHESVVVASPFMAPPTRREPPRADVMTKTPPPAVPPPEERTGTIGTVRGRMPSYVTDPGATGIIENPLLPQRTTSDTTTPAVDIIAPPKDFVRTDPSGTQPAALQPPVRTSTATNPAVPSAPRSSAPAGPRQQRDSPIRDESGTDPLLLTLPLPQAALMLSDEDDDAEPRTMIDENLINRFAASEATNLPPREEPPAGPSMKASRASVAVDDDDDDAATNMVIARPHLLPPEEADYGPEPVTRLMGPTKVVPPAAQASLVGRKTTGGRPANVNAKVAMTAAAPSEHDDEGKSPPTKIYSGSDSGPQPASFSPRRVAPFAAGVIALVAVLLIVIKVVFPNAQGTVEVSSTPPGADIIVDGEMSDKVTPAKLSLSIKEPHVIELHLPGKLPWSETVTLTSESPSVIRAELRNFTAKTGGN